MPQLSEPTVRVRESFLDASRALRDEGWIPNFPVEEVESDFDAYVQSVSGVGHFWGVPVSTRWYIGGDTYLGTVLFRHELTPELLAAGGHIGYHVAPNHRRAGHATRMLALAVERCHNELQIERILVTCEETNTASRRVIEANGGVLENILEHECRYWIA
jgi:predicted acetyltransferase